MTACLFSQGDADPTIKLEFDEDDMPVEGGTGENSVAKPKAPRVKKEKKEPGQHSTQPTPPFTTMEEKEMHSASLLLLSCDAGAPRVRKPPAPKGAKKVKKRNPWSEDESKSDSDIEDSEPIIPRENKSQRASGECQCV